MSRTTRSGAVAAVDLGATSGRVMLGYVGPNELRIQPVARFPNTIVESVDGLFWDIAGLYEKIRGGLASAIRREPQLTSIGVDSWAVDYGLLANNRLIAPPHHYRDPRNIAAAATVDLTITREELYARNGLQYLPFNTLYQLSADRDSGALDHADALLLIPDLINYWLTGEQFAERTNASTTGLLAMAGSDWDWDLAERLSLPRALFPELVSAGDRVGLLLPSIAEILGTSHRVSVNAVGSHDTASAVVAIPSVTPDFAYISCGTWGLVGVELESPVLTRASQQANFTNERGVDGRTRYLHNVMGLWILTECLREWQQADSTIELPGLLAAAARLETPVTVFDANDPVFVPPGEMTIRIAAWCRDHDLPAPRNAVEYVRSITESLSFAFVEAIQQAATLSGKSVSVIHIVGGGSQNELLCQRIADRASLPVLAGPVEATAIGNVLVQARTEGLVTGSLESLRSVVTDSFPPIAYHPSSP